MVAKKSPLKSLVSHWIFSWSDQVLFSVRYPESERIHSYGAACGKLYDVELRCSGAMTHYEDWPFCCGVEITDLLGR